MKRSSVFRRRLSRALRGMREPFVSLYWRIKMRFMADFYFKRTDRNIGWLTLEDQARIRSMVVGIAGCGGMGGLLAAILARLGVGEIRIADNDVFEITNLNRQFGANARTIGRNKARVTGRMVRRIAPDMKVVVEDRGITEETVDAFVKGCDVIADEIEFWAGGSRILLHKAMRKHLSVIFNSPTVGHRVYVTKFTPTSMTMEEVLGMDYPRARFIQAKIQKRTATKDEVAEMMAPMLRFAAPEVPEYSERPEKYSTVKALTDRLRDEQTASIVATNPPMATGFLANQILFHLLEKSETPRNFVVPCPMPGYVMFDAGHLATKKVDAAWFVPGAPAPHRNPSFVHQKTT